MYLLQFLFRFAICFYFINTCTHLYCKLLQLLSGINKNARQASSLKDGLDFVDLRALGVIFWKRYRFVFSSANLWLKNNL